MRSVDYADQKVLLASQIGTFMLGFVLHPILFFFQAEDGIRDIGVTGVQTCALPIYPQALLQNPDQRGRPRGPRTPGASSPRPCARFQDHPSPSGVHFSTYSMLRSSLRSEERRVGKECRYRWSSYDLKKEQTGL